MLASSDHQPYLALDRHWLAWCCHLLQLVKARSSDKELQAYKPCSPSSNYQQSYHWLLGMSFIDTFWSIWKEGVCSNWMVTLLAGIRSIIAVTFLSLGVRVEPKVVSRVSWGSLLVAFDLKHPEKNLLRTYSSQTRTSVIFSQHQTGEVLLVTSVNYM